jgi:CheY-like chemotaxis protein
MEADIAATRPIVLLVEDDESGLADRVGLFAASGCTPIAVRSPDDALRELRASPGVDLMLTDIHLLNRERDKSGIELARRVRREHADLPVAGYSAYFTDDAELGDDTDVFDETWIKGKMTYTQIKETVSTCRALAVDHRRRRMERAFRALDELRRRHEARRPEIEMLRELVPGTAGRAGIEGALLEAGYRLRLVDADIRGLTKPIIVWLLRVEGRTEAEVYGQPALYADADNDREAIENLVDLMHLYMAELREDPDAVAGPALDLKAFLERVVDLDP